MSPFSFRFHQIDAIDGYILALDSNQVFSLEGEQKEWMEAVMQRWEGSLFRFVAYHNPLYPAAEEVILKKKFPTFSLLINHSHSNLPGLLRSRKTTSP